MSLILSGLVNHLDARALSATFVDGRNLILAPVPDQIDPKGWTCTGYDISYSLSGSPGGKPCFNLVQGNINQNNFNDFLNYSYMSVMIAATRTGPSWISMWTGLYSMRYNNAKAGITMLAISDNNFDRNFSYWGTYDYITTAATSAMNINTPYVLSMVGNSDSSGTFYTNASATGTYLKSKDQGYKGVGGYEAGRGYFVGKVYEVLVYNRALTPSEISINSNYLAAKWFN
jgi:hypothetical protein